MYYLEKDGKVFSTTSIQLDGYEEAPELKNDIYKYKIVDNEFYLNPSLYNPKSSQEYLDSVEKIHTDDIELFENKFKTLKRKEYQELIQKHIDSVVSSLGYDDSNSIAKYLIQENVFYDECKAISLWIGSVWAEAIRLQNEYEAGNIDEPVDVISILPEFVQ